MNGNAPATVEVDERERRALEAFVFLEAELADAARYDEWEALVTDDMHYWVPHGPADYDPATRLSYVNDNRARLATRIRQLTSGKRWAQQPASALTRVIGNIQVREAHGPDGPWIVSANFILHEVALQATGDTHVWAGRYRYTLRREQGRMRMARKIVELSGGELPQPNLAFLL